MQDRCIREALHGILDLVYNGIFHKSKKFYERFSFLLLPSDAASFAVSLISSNRELIDSIRGASGDCVL
ncbi:hypothetical protein L1987_05205 [Smallanthus sonchifolius]|uniref:Uncharacterized protein n=1 Tax=Smallanthus sonchifolius TaxID=185202 RepID=A0ACB9JUP9_9ASTR|nr:hypothetical protein L1987_05205 [Smallanthus sonchifolius]